VGQFSPAIWVKSKSALTLLNRLAMRLEQAGQCIPEVFEEVPPVCDLNSIWGALPSVFRIAASAIPTNNLNAGMVLQPLGEGLREAIWEEVDHCAAFEIDDDARVGLAFAKRIELSRPVTEPARLQNRA
jgi:hypothetical protein